MADIPQFTAAEVRSARITMGSETPLAVLAMLDAFAQRLEQDAITDGLTPSQIKDCAAAALNEAREEGRREILVEIAKVTRPCAWNANHDSKQCVFCLADEDETGDYASRCDQVIHRPDCLWLRAQSLTSEAK